MSLPPLPETMYVLGIKGVGYQQDILTEDAAYTDEQMQQYAWDALLEFKDRLQIAYVPPVQDVKPTFYDIQW